MGARTRLMDIAKQAKVSTATVSRVLNGRAGVAEETRRAVLSALDMLGYERPPKLRTRSAGLVGLIIPELTNPVFPAFAQEIESMLTSKGFTPLLCTQSPGGVSEDHYLEQLTLHKVEGIVFIAGMHADLTAPTTRYDRLLGDGVPFVFINGTNPRLPVPSFSIDEARSAEIAVHHLASLGHTNIGLATGQSRYAATRGKMRGFMRAMERLGQKNPKIVTTLFSSEGGAAAAAMLLDEGVSAIVCASVPMALGAIEQARARGISVPGELSVVGFDDSPILAHTYPPLTTVRQPVSAICRAATATLLDMIQEAPCPRTEIVFAPELIVRGSTARASGALPHRANPTTRS